MFDVVWLFSGAATPGLCQPFPEHFFQVFILVVFFGDFVLLYFSGILSTVVVPAIW